MDSLHLRVGVRLAGLFFLLLAAGCVRAENTPPAGPPVTGTTQGGVVAVEPAIQPATPPATPPTTPPATPPATRPTDQGVAKTDSPATKTPVPVKVPETVPVKVPASPATTVQPLKKEPAAPAPVKQPASPPLDLKSLEQRLRDTKAIGVFTKLSLKNQVDDLLSQFRTFHDGGRAGAALTELRERYNLLLLKVLSLLQGSDPMLAQAIAGSREAIWGVLADPVKFAKI